MPDAESTPASLDTPREPNTKENGLPVTGARGQSVTALAEIREGMQQTQMRYERALAASQAETQQVRVELERRLDDAERRIAEAAGDLRPRSRRKVLEGRKALTEAHAALDRERRAHAELQEEVARLSQAADETRIEAEGRIAAAWAEADEAIGHARAEAEGSVAEATAAAAHELAQARGDLERLRSSFAQQESELALSEREARSALREARERLEAERAEREAEGRRGETDALRAELEALRPRAEDRRSGAEVGEVRPAEPERIAMEAASPGVHAESGHTPLAARLARLEASFAELRREMVKSPRDRP